MNNLKLSRNFLKIMLRTAAKKDVRTYLTTVKFVAKDGFVLAYAADGHKLARWIVVDGYSGPDFSYVISRSSIDMAVKTKLPIELDTETGDLICQAEDDRTILNGVLSIEYPDAEEGVISYIRLMGKDAVQSPVISSHLLQALGKVGKLLSKEYKLDAMPVRFYSSQREGHVANIFTFNGNSDLIYIIAGQKAETVTHQEHRAVLLDDYKAPFEVK